MRLIDRIAARFGFMPRAVLTQHAARLTMARKFDAAVSSRLTTGWSTRNQSLDAEIRMDLPALRARSRDLSINNDYGRKFLRMVRDNVVGPHGFTLQATPTREDGTPDKADSDAIEAAFREWSRAGECELTGKMSLATLCRVWIMGIAREGEALVRRVRSPASRFGYQLQLIDIDRLDVMFNSTSDAGNKIRMSIEFDAAGRAVAYWLLKNHPGDYQVAGQTVERERVPAADIWHHFTPERPEQSRGFPWMAASMMRLQMLGGYEEAAIVAARAGAAKMGFFVSPDGDASLLANGVEGSTETNDPGAFTSSAEAGTFDVLPQGYDFKQYNPEYPTQNYDAFVKSCLRGISSGLGVAYNALANDLEGVNFSSIRAGVLEEREAWMTLQEWAIDSFMRPLFLEWLEMALLKGAIAGPGGRPLPAGKLFKFQSHRWQARRWPWVDPVKDIEAARLAIQTGIASPQMIAAQAGVDTEDVLASIAEFEAQLAAGKITSVSFDKGPAMPAAMPPAPAAPAAAKAHDTAELLERTLGRLVDRLEAIERDIKDQRTAPEQRVVNNYMDGTLNSLGGQIVGMLRTAIEGMPAPVVNIGGAQINVEPTPVTLEATVESPIVNVRNNVQVDVPETTVRVEIPPRRTDSTVTRNGAGEIVHVTQLETNA